MSGDEIKAAFARGNKILTAGNGGSAADALHLSEELVGKYNKMRPGFPCVCLSADSTLLTCIGNDFGFDLIFARQVQALGCSGDILVVFSTSGNSENILLAIDTARKKGVKTIALLGKDGGRAKGKADIEIIVPTLNTARIQEVHTFILHSWLECLESAIG
jgi:D-sedoheptulose 7-phosphate isomerase